MKQDPDFPYIRGMFKSAPVVLLFVLLLFLCKQC